MATMRMAVPITSILIATLPPSGASSPIFPELTVSLSPSTIEVTGNVSERDVKLNGTVEVETNPLTTVKVSLSGDCDSSTP
ncbi:MAG: hypothetical protein ACUVV6_00765 [Thermoplasmatota archaeon]